MATIFPRKNRDGSTSWRVMIRRARIKPFISSFCTEQEAKEFVDRYEEIYCLDPDGFTWDKLKKAREREFKRKIREY